MKSAERRSRSAGGSWCWSTCGRPRNGSPDRLEAWLSHGAGGRPGPFAVGRLCLVNTKTVLFIGQAVILPNESRPHIQENIETSSSDVSGRGAGCSASSSSLPREWRPGAPSPIVAVAVTKTKRGNTHVGIAYAEGDDTEELSFMHLEFHCKLFTGSIDNSYIYIKPNLKTEELEAVATRCRKIARNKTNKMIKYAFKYNRRTVFGKDGYLFCADGKGLNCSTFILTIFHSVNLGLVNENTWKARPEDEIIFTQLRDYLKSHIEKHFSNKKDHAEHVRKVAPDVKSIRIRPEETAGACLEDTYPVSYERCAPNGRELVKEISSRQSTPPRSSKKPTTQTPQPTGDSPST